MENENVQQPTYEQLAQGYQQLQRELERMQMEYAALRQDKILERLEAMTHIVEEKDKFPEKIVKLAEKHMLKIMEFPK